MTIVYETGIELPEILGSGSSFMNVITTKNEEVAFREYRNGSRNYLLKRTFYPDRPRTIEYWDDERKCWRMW